MIALKNALFLTKFATHIDLLVRSKIRASEVLQRELEKNPKISVHLGVTTEEILGKEGKVVAVKGKQNDKEITFQTDGVFVFIGLIPNTQFAAAAGIECDEHGFIKTDGNLTTALPGVFASGDVRSGATMQIASAAGEGATAALMIRYYLDSLQTPE